MFPVILVSRNWLLFGPLLALVPVGAAWAADHWASWDWLRETAAVLAWLVCIGVALWGMGSTVILTRGGFWVPFDGRGRWGDVMARDDLTVTLRVSEKYGMDRLVSFDRVEGWSAMARILDARLPSDLPGIEMTEPHQQWRRHLEELADDLVRRVARQVTPPAAERSWLRPADGEGFAVHRLRLAFEPAADGSVVEVRLGSEWSPEIRVDDCYAYFPDPAFDEESDDGVESADEGLAEAVALLVSVFRAHVASRCGPGGSPTTRARVGTSTRVR